MPVRFLFGRPNASTSGLTYDPYSEPVGSRISSALVNILGAIENERQNRAREAIYRNILAGKTGEDILPTYQPKNETTLGKILGGLFDVNRPPATMPIDNAIFNSAMKQGTSSRQATPDSLLRQAVGIDLTPQEIVARYSPRGIPYAGGGYVGVEPGRKLGPDEYLGENVTSLPQYANYYYNKDLVNRARQAGYEPTIKGFRKIKTKLFNTESDKRRARNKVIWDFLKTVSPNAEQWISSVISKRYGGVGNASELALKDFLRTYHKSGSDIVSYVESKYGQAYARELFPEYYMGEK